MKPTRMIISLHITEERATQLARFVNCHRINSGSGITLQEAAVALETIEQIACHAALELGEAKSNAEMRLCFNNNVYRWAESRKTRSKGGRPKKKLPPDFDPSQLEKIQSVRRE